MKRCLVVLLMLLGFGPAHAQLFFNARLVRPVQDIAAGYNGFDINADGIVEINSISLMSFEPTVPAGSGYKGLALVLVEPRLLNSSSASLNASLQSMLQNHRDDLVREGYQVRTLLLDVYRGPVHQDGRTLLAIRRFLQAVYAEHALKGVTLVGSFPEASLMRRVLERKVTPEGLQSLALVPERVNPRAEIVLADLDGKWESLYLPTFSKESLVLGVPTSTVFPRSDQNVGGTVTQLDTVTGEDIFFIRDDFAFRSTTAPVLNGPAAVYIGSTGQNNPELSDADRTQPNPIARPEILVSRIDAHGVSFNPTGPRDIYGRTPLDANGKPQTIEYPSDGGIGQLPLRFDRAPGGGTPAVHEDGLDWTPDPLLEQRILISYFDRNHQHRLGIGHASQYRVSTVQQYNSGLPSPYEFNFDVLRLADPYNFSDSQSFEQANLFYYAYFLKTPAILRGVLSHSTGRESGFYNHTNEQPQNNGYYPLVDMMIGGYPWAWDGATTAAGTKLRTPSAKAFRERATWEFARTVWENRTLMYVGNSFYLHDGCSVTVPDDNYTTSYDDLKYGYKNNADSVLLFQNGLAILARGKVFNDRPAGFGASIFNAGGQFGAAWRGYFAAEAANAARKPGSNADYRVLHNKQSYFWSLRGDWTLKLRY